MDLVTACYQVTQVFPRSEAFGLTSQLRRAAVSVPANIAEGQARQHGGEFVQFLSIARGSLAELETHLLIATRLGYMEQSESLRLLEQTGEVGRMLNALRTAIRAKSTNREPTPDN
jgi:four helix bundle protein